MKERTNTQGIKSKWTIAVIHKYNEVRFVTGTHGKNAEWEENKQPMEFSKRKADEIALELSINGYPAMVVEIPEYLMPVNRENYNNKLTEVKLFNSGQLLFNF